MGKRSEESYVQKLLRNDRIIIRRMVIPKLVQAATPVKSSAYAGDLKLPLIPKLSNGLSPKIFLTNFFKTLIVCSSRKQSVESI